ncbi:MAG: calcium-binding protein [Parvularculaceae bacterium]
MKRFFARLFALTVFILGAGAVALVEPDAPAPLRVEAAAPVKGKQVGLIRPPVFERSEEALAQFRLRNNWKRDSASDYVTFGQAFEEGALEPGDFVAAKYGDMLLLAQIDVKALHEDGSVRHAAVTVAAPRLGSGEEIDGVLIRANSVSLEDFNAAAIISRHYSFPVALKFYYGDGSTRPFALDARALALGALENGSADLWLDGALVKEFRVEKQAAPHLLLRFDIRVYRDGDIRTDIVFSNEKTFSSGRRESLYDVRIGPESAPVWSVERIGHHRAATWRRTFWTGRQPRLFVTHDLELLIASGAVAPLDGSLGIAADLIARQDAALSGGVRPLSPVFVERFFPATGGRPDIGLTPQWVATYLVAQTEASARVMFANADAGGAVPWHFRDEADGAPVRVDRRLKFWADPRGLEAQYAPDRPHPDIFASSAGGWTPDHSHKPALSYVPYLVTASRYFGDELAMQAAWALNGRWPQLREGGLKAIGVEQVRASAWSLRDISDAAFILPDDHLLKDYFKQALHDNLDAMVEKYVVRRAMRDAGELEGYFEELIEREPERISPWQNDYVVLALWLAARRGEGGALKLLEWAENFHTGRFLSPDFEPKHGTAYIFAAKDGPTQKPYARWADVAAKTYGGVKAHALSKMEGYPELATGYIGSAYAALTAIASATGSLSAYEALGWLARETRSYPMWNETENGGAQANNRFLFSLRSPGGGSLSRADIRTGNGDGGSDEILGDDDGALAKGGGGNDILYGFEGDDRLEGGDGADMLFGGAGDDHLKGGAGADRLVGGRGDDIMSGGAGFDLFAYLRGPYGNDRILDFDPEEDVVGLSSHAPFGSAQALNFVENTPEGAWLSFGEKTGILLVGVKKATLKADSFRAVQ